MSLLKMFSEFQSFKDFIGIDDFVPYSIYDKDEKRNESLKYKRYRISFRTSTASWDDIDNQIADTINYLDRNIEKLQKLFSTYRITRSYLDFPVYLRINDNVVNQNEYIHEDLIKKISAFGIGVQLSIYDKKYLTETNKTDLNKLLMMHDKGEY